MCRKTVLAGFVLFLSLIAAASAQTAARELCVSPGGVFPSLAATGAGDFVVAWQEPRPGSFNDVLVRLFYGSGKPQGAPFFWADSFGEQTVPAGNFVGVWQGGLSSAVTR
jgi:hypothetical protein